METNDVRKLLENMFAAQKHTSAWKDSAMVGIMTRRQEYEETLTKMWRIYTSGNMKQVFEYKKLVNEIKAAGLVVLRNKAGNHKIVYQKEA